MPDHLSKKQKLKKRYAAMKKTRDLHVAHYKELARNAQPRRGRFDDEKPDARGKRKINSIINNKGLLSLRAATAGMFAGTMSPSRPWFVLETPDPGMMEFSPVRVWLSGVEAVLRQLFNQSNLYNMAPTALQELLLFGIGNLTHVDDAQDVMRFYAHTVGSYVISQNEKYVVNGMARRYRMTVEQMVSEFTLNNVSQTVSNAYDNGNYHGSHVVVHDVQENIDANRKLARVNSRFMPFASIKYEENSADDTGFLKESGFRTFPAYITRWETTNEDLYATNSPGMVTLGDMNALQIEEKRKAQAIAKMVNPPLKGPPSLKNVNVNSLPGGMTVHAGGPTSGELKPIYTVNPQIQELMLDIEKIERRIEEGFFGHLFMAISTMEGIQPKNQLELSQRDAERLLQLGPVLEQLHGGMLDPMVSRGFDQANIRGLIPPPPPELENTPLKIVYISSIAQAQRAVATNAIERVAGYVTGLIAGGLEGAADKFDAEQSIDEFSRLTGAPPKIVRSDDAVEKLREARALAEQQAQAMAVAQQGADITKTLSEAGTEGESALSAITEAIG